MSNLEYSTNRHSYYCLNYHLVVVTKYRHKCINKAILERLKEIAYSIFKKNKCVIAEINGEADHVHISFQAPPQVQLSKLINSFKSVSSRYIRKEFAEHLSKYYWKPYFWNDSYFILSTGGAPQEIIKKYIENQNSPEN